MTAAVQWWPGDTGALTKVGLIAVALAMTLLALALLPPRMRPSGVVVPAAAAAVAFVAHRVAAETTFSEWLDHEVLERIGGEVDDVVTWAVALAAALVVLVVAHVVRRR